MERYSEWRDARTGVHPFVPPRVPPGAMAFGARVGRAILGLFLTLVRLPLLLGCMFQLLVGTLIAEQIARVLPSILWGTVGRLLLRYLHVVFGRCALFFLGVLWVSPAWARVKLGRAAESDAARSMGTRGGHVGRGTVIVANRTGFLDVLVLAFKFSPVFTLTVGGLPPGEPKALVRRTFAQALLDALLDRRLVRDDVAKMQTLQELVKAARDEHAALVVFPEGATTNGRAVLSAASPDVLEGARVGGDGEEANDVAVVFLKYRTAEADGFTPAGSLRSPLNQVFSLIAHLSTPVDIRYLLPAENADAVNGSPDAGETTRTSGLTRLLAAAGRIRVVAGTAADKSAFLAKWRGKK